jgi:hypothetical protein
VRLPVTVLAGRGTLVLAVECLVNDTVTAMLATYLGLLAISVALMQLFGEELEELVSVLFLGGDQVVEGFVLADPEAGEDISRCVAICDLRGVKILEHVIHSAAEAVLRVTAPALMSIAEVEVPYQRVMQECLQNNVLVAGCTGIVDTSKTVGAARGDIGVVGDKSRIVCLGIHEHLVVFPLATYHVYERVPY